LCSSKLEQGRLEILTLIDSAIAETPA